MPEVIGTPENCGDLNMSPYAKSTRALKPSMVIEWLRVVEGACFIWYK